jgi:hypothetical protein
MEMLSNDGKFDPRGVKARQRSFVAVHIFKTEPALAKYYTEAFLRKRGR